MTHIRSQIRKKAAEVVKELPITNLKTVYSSKVMNLVADHHIPCVQVYFEDGTVDLIYLQGLEENDAILQVEIIASDATNVDDRLDEIAAVIEPALKEHSKLSGLVAQLTLKGFGYTRDDKTSLASLTLTYRVKFKQ